MRLYAHAHQFHTKIIIATLRALLAINKFLVSFTAKLLTG
jgi:hypothetical protein